jgi:uncharacterized protein
LIPSIFVDTSYWVALFNLRDTARTEAATLAIDFDDYVWVTTDAVLFETLNWFSKADTALRVFVSESIEAIIANERIEIVTSGRNWLIATTEFYGKRKDKQWSGVDCFSMLVMESKNIQDVLTTDKHFRQAGFNVLMLEHSS